MPSWRRFAPVLATTPGKDGTMTTKQSARATGLRRLLHFALVGMFAVAAHLLASVLLGAYTEGDRRHYSQFYDAISHVELWEVPNIQRAHTGSGEPIYGAVMWLGARLAIPNQIYIGIANGLLCGLLAALLLRARAVFWMYPLVFSNFYLLVLLTSAERLKYAAIFILLGLLSGGTARAILFLAAPFTHVQTLVVYAAAAVGLLFDARSTVSILGRTRSRTSISIFAAIILIIFIWQHEYIIAKIAAYADSGGDIFVMLGITALTYLTFPNRINLVLSIGSLCIASFVLGGERINMMGYILYAYYCFTYNRGNSPYLAVMSIYVSYKSIGYVQSIFSVGHGFG